MATLQVYINGELKQNMTTFYEQVKEEYDNWIKAINKEKRREVDITIILKKSGRCSTIKQVFPKTV